MIKYVHDISEAADASLSPLLFLFDMKSKMRRRQRESAWCMSMLSMLSLRTSSVLPLNHALFWTRAQIQAHYSSSPILPSSSPLICGLALITNGENDIPTWAHYNVWYLSFTESQHTYTKGEYTLKLKRALLNVVMQNK